VHTLIFHPAAPEQFLAAENGLRPFQLSATAFGRFFCLAVPELTRSTGIQLNERVSLRRPFEILSSIQSCGLASAAPTGHAYRAIRGRC
jgi:hypothetical protein